METKHSPAPWRIEASPTRPHLLRILDADSKRVCEIASCDSVAETQANAELIVAVANVWNSTSALQARLVELELAP